MKIRRSCFQVHATPGAELAREDVGSGGEDVAYDGLFVSKLRYDVGVVILFWLLKRLFIRI